MRFIVLLEEGIESRDFIYEMKHRGVFAEKFHDCHLICVIDAVDASAARKLPGVIKADPEIKHNE